MDRNGLLDADESDFLDAVRNFILVEGRGSVVNAMLVDRANGELEQQEVISVIGSPDDVDSQSSDDDRNDVGSSDDDNDDQSVENLPEINVYRMRLHDPVVHDHCHCPPFIDMSETFIGVPCGVCDCDDFNFASCFQENNF